MISVAAPGLCHCGSADILVTRTSPFSSRRSTPELRWANSWCTFWPQWR